MTRWMTIDQLAEYLSCSKGSAIKIGDKAGAKSKIGRLVRYDRNMIDQYMVESTQEGQTPWQTH